MTSESKSSGDTDREDRLVSSEEWARHQLRDIFSRCLQTAASLQQAQTQKARSAEAEYFILLAYTFNQDHDLGAFAKLVTPRAGVSAGTLNTFRQLMMVAAMRALDGSTDAIFR